MPDLHSLSVPPYYVLAGSLLLLAACVQLFEWTINSPSQHTYLPPLRGTSYKLVKEYSGSTFFNGFNFEDAVDPTHGHVSYKNRIDSSAMNLTYIGDDQLAYIHVDSQMRAPRGRASVRLSTKQRYTRGLFVLDVLHMPEGCGTWPAFWSTAVDAWPNKGEIDILEGVNLETDNAFTLHTGPDCRQPALRTMLGSTETSDCDVRSKMQWPNQGCGVKTKDSFGKSFNEKLGAVVVMEWTETVIRMWIFNRDDAPNVDTPDTSDWRTPDAVFDDSECDLERIFKDHVFIINCTLCGDWAGNVFGSSNCPGTSCESFVTEHPEAFIDAYWAIRSLKAFQLR